MKKVYYHPSPSPKSKVSYVLFDLHETWNVASIGIVRVIDCVKSKFIPLPQPEIKNSCLWSDFQETWNKASSNKPKRRAAKRLVSKEDGVCSGAEALPSFVLSSVKWVGCLTLDWRQIVLEQPNVKKLNQSRLDWST